jgi:hypothetical protein
MGSLYFSPLKALNIKKSQRSRVRIDRMRDKIHPTKGITPRMIIATKSGRKTARD